jgi:hypothetical protein
MNMRTLLLRVGTVLAGVLTVLVFSPSAALACGISYENTPGSPTSGCSATASVTGIAIVGGLAVSFAATLAAVSFLRGAMSASDLASLLDQIPTAPTLGDTVTLVDGSQLAVLDTAGQAAFAAYAANLPTRQCTDVGAEYDYQRAKLGDTESNVAPDPDRETWADGLSRQWGAAQDAKFRRPGSNTSIYDPTSFTSERMREIAEREMDRRLIKYRDAIRAEGSPLRALEMLTNDVGVAMFLRDRLAALRIPGFVRVEL